MIALRSVLYALFLSVITVPWAIFSLFLVFFPPVTRYDLITAWTDAALWGARNICGIRQQVVGLENVPEGGCIFLAKHQSRWETIAFRSLFRRVCYVYKRELHWIPFFGWGIALLPMIPIDRSSSAALDQVIERGGRRLKEGWRMVLFPEGTRVKPGSTARYKPGGAMLAIGTGALVVPIAHNAGDCWPRDTFLKYPGTITISIGPAIDPRGMTPKALTRKVEHWIEGEMHARFAHQYGAAPQGKAA